MGSRIVAVLDVVPHTAHGGGGVTGYAAVRSMAESGASVHVLALGGAAGHDAERERHHVRHLEALGITFEGLPEHSRAIPPSTLYRRFQPGIEDLYPIQRRRTEIAAALRRSKPDALFMYHWNAIAAVHGISDYPKLGTVGDPMDLPYLFHRALQRRYGRVPATERMRDAVIRRTRLPAMRRAMVTLLNECDASGAFAAHHADELRAAGVARCEYFRTPTPDPGRTVPEPSAADKVLRVLHIGHLQGIATLSGVELLVNEIIPALERELRGRPFEIHLVGGSVDSVPEPIRRKLAHPAIRVRGQVSPADDEFLRAHAVLVPTPIELGIRVRILTAFSFGSCVIAHDANRRGIPEMVHNENALLGRTGGELADAVVRSWDDPHLRARLQASARATYDRYFSLARAGGAIFRAASALARS